MKKTLGVFLVGLVLSACGATKNVVTRAEYDQIRTGMSRSEVESIIGESGEELSSGGGSYIYSWKNVDGSNALITFMNGGVYMKAQSGL